MSEPRTISDQPEFGRLVQAAMHARGVNYSQLAARLILATGENSYSPTSVRRIVLGDRKPSSAQVEDLIGVLSPELDADAARAAAVA
jgi:hypothetical protein